MILSEGRIFPSMAIRSINLGAEKRYWLGQPGNDCATTGITADCWPISRTKVKELGPSEGKQNFVITMNMPNRPKSRKVMYKVGNSQVFRRTTGVSKVETFLTTGIVKYKKRKIR